MPTSFPFPCVLYCVDKWASKFVASGTIHIPFSSNTLYSLGSAAALERAAVQKVESDAEGQK